MKTLLALLLLIPSLSWGLTLNEIFNVLIHTDLKDIVKAIFWIAALIIGGYIVLLILEEIEIYIGDFFRKRDKKKVEKAKNDWEPDREKRIKSMNREMFIFKSKGIIYALIIPVFIVILIIYA
jgi:hypothetical protein